MSDVENKEVAEDEIVLGNEMKSSQPDPQGEVFIPAYQTVQGSESALHDLVNKEIGKDISEKVASGVAMLSKDTQWGTLIKEPTFEDSVNEGWTRSEEDWRYFRKAVKSIMAASNVGYIEKVSDPRPFNQCYPEIYAEDGSVDVEGLIAKGRDLIAAEEVHLLGRELTQEERDQAQASHEKLLNGTIPFDAEGFEAQKLSEALPASDQFVQALALGERPVIDETVQVSNPGYAWNPDYMLETIACIYPISLVRLGRQSEVDPIHKRKVDALVKFYEVLVEGDHPDLRVFQFPAIIGDTEVTWVRYQTDIGSASFVVETAQIDRWVDAMTTDETMNWCMQENTNKDLQAAGYPRNVSKRYDSIELPLSVFQKKASEFLIQEPVDALVNGDFIQLDTLLAKLQGQLRVHFGDITKAALEFIKAPVRKDHDLYLVFKTKDDFSTVTGQLEKVYPKLPEGGELELGNNPVTEFELTTAQGNVVETLLKRIHVLNKHIVRDITKVRNLLAQNPIILDEFQRLLKLEFLAAAHFMKKVYGFQESDGIALVQEVANEIISALNKKAITSTYPIVSVDSVKVRNLGLDLNSWIVWEYKDGEEPVRVEDEELQFVDTLFNRYTESFINVLQGFLMNLGNPLIKPYHSVTPADLSDGHAIGSIRRVS